MTSGQRRAHRYIWLVIIIAIPVLVFFSIQNLDFLNSAKDTILTLDVNSDRPIKTSENDFIKASLFTQDSIHSIEVILKSPLKNASSVMYELNNDDTKGTIIGQITVVGIYNFELANLPKGIVIYDALKETLITNLEF